MRALFAVGLAGMGGIGVVERLAVDVLRVLGQMVRGPMAASRDWRDMACRRSSQAPAGMMQRGAKRSPASACLALDQPGPSPLGCRHAKNDIAGLGARRCGRVLQSRWSRRRWRRAARAGSASCAGCFALHRHHSRIDAREKSLRAVSSAPSTTARSSFSRRSAALEFLDLLLGGLPLGGRAPASSAPTRL